MEEDEFYDVIVANLPYIGEVKNRFVSDSTQKYEPNVALFGGDTGVELYERMLKEVTDKGVNFYFNDGRVWFCSSRSYDRINRSLF